MQMVEEGPDVAVSVTRGFSEGGRPVVEAVHVETPGLDKAGVVQGGRYREETGLASTDPLVGDLQLLAQLGISLVYFNKESNVVAHELDIFITSEGAKRGKVN